MSTLSLSFFFFFTGANVVPPLGQALANSPREICHSYTTFNTCYNDTGLFGIYAIAQRESTSFNIYHLVSRATRNETLPWHETVVYRYTSYIIAVWYLRDETWKLPTSNPPCSVWYDGGRETKHEVTHRPANMVSGIMKRTLPTGTVRRTHGNETVIWWTSRHDPSYHARAAPTKLWKWNRVIYNTSMCTIWQDKTKHKILSFYYHGIIWYHIVSYDARKCELKR